MAYNEDTDWKMDDDDMHVTVSSFRTLYFQSELIFSRMSTFRTCPSTLHFASRLLEFPLISTHRLPLPRYLNCSFLGWMSNTLLGTLNSVGLESIYLQRNPTRTKGSHRPGSVVLPGYDHGMLVSFSIGNVPFQTHHQTQAQPQPQLQLRLQSQIIQFPHLLNLHVHDIAYRKDQLLVHPVWQAHRPRHSSSNLRDKRKGQSERRKRVGELLQKGICRTRMRKRNTGTRRRTWPSE